MKCLIVGGGGPVGIGLLYLLKNLNATFAVVDPLRPKYLALHEKNLAGHLLNWIEKNYTLADLEAHLTREKFDFVIDLAPTFDKRLSVTLCDNLGVSLINSTMVDYKDDIHIAAFNFLDKRPDAKNKPHIVASGMNPGACNAMAEEIIAIDGVPDEIVFWEYDDGAPASGKFTNTATTWCQGESHDEFTNDWNFEVIEEGTIHIHEDALSWEPQNFRELGIPLDNLPIPPDGDAMLIGHEECVYLGWRHDTACKFIYGLHPDNMIEIRKKQYEPGKPDLLLCEPNKPIQGRDIMGVSCRYEEDGTWSGLYCMLENTIDTPADTNATCILVAAGVAAAVKVLAEGKVPAGVHLTHEVAGYMAAFRTFATVHECTVYDKPDVAHESSAQVRAKMKK